MLADGKSHVAFCNGEQNCVVSRIYDQTENANHLAPAPPGENTPVPDDPVNANAHKVWMINQVTKESQQVYGAKFDNHPPMKRPGNMGYRNDKTKNIPKGDEPETIYAVLNGNHYSYHCCFDYGNAESDNNDDGAGTMEALNFGSHQSWPEPFKPLDAGEPFVLADLEDGLWAGNKTTKPVAIHADFVFGMLKGNMGNQWALAHANARDKASFVKTYEGIRPPGYEVMKKQGGIILGIGGDNSNRGEGTFYEGVIVQGYTDDETDRKVHENVVNAGYHFPSFAMDRDATATTTGLFKNKDGGKQAAALADTEAGPASSVSIVV
eukprot:TRINITY_DN104062_c0_g1_i1.p1 TRINITY_DN104062_c0_g1~~TRINITY_DN104062_c0_g1_i1.p1  ORF type:complete len:323 (+),score=54.39 TRINITY_DN104062_c0_g1_i1:163-1131(+)